MKVVWKIVLIVALALVILGVAAIAVSLFSPYLITENPWTPAAVINTGSYCPASQRAAVKLIYGEIEANTRPPQDLLMDDRPLEEWAKIQYKSAK